MWCKISGEAAGEIWNWSLLGLKGLIICTTNPQTQGQAFRLSNSIFASWTVSSEYAMIAVASITRTICAILSPKSFAWSNSEFFLKVVLHYFRLYPRMSSKLQLPLSSTRNRFLWRPFRISQYLSRRSKTRVRSVTRLRKSFPRRSSLCGYQAPWHLWFKRPGTHRRTWKSMARRR